jgi:hypothetical protein
VPPSPEGDMESRRGTARSVVAASELLPVPWPKKRPWLRRASTARSIRRHKTTQTTPASSLEPRWSRFGASFTPKGPRRPVARDGASIVCHAGLLQPGRTRGQPAGGPHARPNEEERSAPSAHLRDPPTRRRESSGAPAAIHIVSDRRFHRPGPPPPTRCRGSVPGGPPEPADPSTLRP